MKKIITFILVAIMLIATTACSNSSSAKGSVTVVIGGATETVYQIDIENVEISEGLLSVLKYLQQSQSLSLEFSDDGASAYLSKVGELENDYAKGEYIYLYTSVDADFDVSGYAKTISYGENKLTSSGVSVKQMSVVDGAIYYVGLIKF